MTDKEMIELEPEILKQAQERVLLRDHLARLVVKEQWPKTDTGFVTFEPANIGNGNGVNYSVRTYSLKHAAVDSAGVCLYEHPDKELIKRSVSDVAFWMWSYYFRNELLKVIQNRMVVRNLREVPDRLASDLTRIISSNERHINLFGKSVNRFQRQPSSNGMKYILNPKYGRAARQVIFFSPDTIHFQFLNPEQWIGEIQWKNIPDEVTNPDGKIGFYRLITTAAAKPMSPTAGLVVTVVPKGLRGLIYYWAWKLFRFVP